MTPPDTTDNPLDEVVIVAVTDSDDISGSAGDEPVGDEAPIAGLTREELTETLTDLQTELAGTTRTGVPAVDAALDRLNELDPDDLAGSAEILSDVLARLESVMGEAPKD